MLQPIFSTEKSGSHHRSQLICPTNSFTDRGHLWTVSDHLAAWLMCTCRRTNTERSSHMQPNAYSLATLLITRAGDSGTRARRRKSYPTPLCSENLFSPFRNQGCQPLIGPLTCHRQLKSRHPAPLQGPCKFLGHPTIWLTTPPLNQRMLWPCQVPHLLTHLSAHLSTSLNSHILPLKSGTLQ